ncbi:MAG: AI-2E family transporter [Flavobacteriaceae bacterium]
MTIRQQIKAWLIVLLATGLALWLLRGILLPFVAGMALAYFLDPVADRLERLGLSRLMATVVITLVFVLLFVLAFLAIVPTLIRQLADFAEMLPTLVTKLQNLVATLANSRLAQFFDVGGEGQNGQFSGMIGTAGSWLASLAKSLLSGGLAFVNIISLLIVTPVVAFYLLLDWDNMVARVDSWLPRDHLSSIRQLTHDIDQALAGFVRGQGTVCIVLGLFYGVGLTLTGLNFGLLIGLGAGLISFIPYVGSIVGLAVSLGVALVQFWPDYIMIGVVAGVFFVGQFLEGNFLSPKLVGDNIGLHPVWLMFALFAFGYLFGFVGMLLAVPIAAAIGVVSRFGLRHYLASRLYRGTSDEGGGGI